MGSTSRHTTIGGSDSHAPMAFAVSAKKPRYLNSPSTDRLPTIEASSQRRRAAGSLPSSMRIPAVWSSRVLNSSSDSSGTENAA